MLKVHNLQNHPVTPGAVECDVCIIGAGAAGLYLATRLAEKGESVVILEAGGEVCEDTASIGLEPVFTGEFYPGATLGRAFGLGGSTSRWGGLLVPHSRHDVRSVEAENSDPWQSIVRKVQRRTGAVFSHLGLGSQSDFDRLASKKLGTLSDRLKAQQLDTVAAQFLPLTSRNLAYLLRRSKGGQNIRLFLNAVANAWQFGVTGNRGSSISAVSAVSKNGNRVTIAAKEVVVAAGAIESARILLEMRRQGGKSIISETAEVGQNLSDHLSCRIAEVAATDYGRVAASFGPQFARGCMRSFRFIESDLKPDTPRCFAHFIFEINNPAFHLAKEALASVQARRWPRLGVGEWVAGTAGLFSFAYSRYVRSALFVPKGTPVHLQLDIEQTPVKTNAVSLSEEMDQYGRPVAKIHWRVENRDTDNIRQAAVRILGKWPGRRGGLFDLAPVFTAGREPKPHDAYHPVGTCRLGFDEGAVVDGRLRVRGTDNLWILSTAVLPSAGTANPTFTMLCLGDELADELTTP